jgi:ethanolaminephosphotransferase
MSLFNYRYLRSDHLKGLNEYKYNAVDTSPVSIYLMQPFWNWGVEFFPRWFAPNLMTFLGFLLLVVNFLLFSYYDFHFTEAFVIPSWLWLIAAVCQFASHQLDGMDGKQARRTKSSSALGELFDHGVDSWASFLFPVCIFSAISKIDDGLSPMAMHLLLISIYITFIDSHWEKYNTKVLFLPWSYDISMLLMTITYLLTCFYTPIIFRFNVPILNVMFIRVLEYAWPLCGLLSSIPISIIHIHESYRTGKGYNRTFYEAIRPLISPTILFISSIWWGFASPHRILDAQPRIFLAAVGTTFSNIACRLVVAQMTSTRSEGINTLLYIFVPIQILSVYGVFNERTELTFLFLYNTIATLAHLHYGCCVVRQICNHLNIYAFKITDRSKEPPPAEVRIKH